MTFNVGDRVRYVGSRRDWFGRDAIVQENDSTKYDVRAQLQLTDEEATITTGFLAGVRWNGVIYGYADEFLKT